MPNIDKWAGNTFPLSAWSDDTDKGVDNARILADQTTSITIIRAGVAQAVQTVRIEGLRGDRATISEGGITAQVDALVIGYKSHPTIADTDIQRGDRFAVNGNLYEVVAIAPGLPDSLQAYIKVKS